MPNIRFLTVCGDFLSFGEPQDSRIHPVIRLAC